MTVSFFLPFTAVVSIIIVGVGEETAIDVAAIPVCLRE